jgi:4'-phosphopantetheinyl transferase
VHRVMSPGARPWPSPNEVQLWRATLDVPPPLAGRFAASLSEDERTAAARRRDAVDRLRYVAAQGWLRMLLAGYLGADPRALPLSRSVAGKPSVAAEARLRFNMSHCGSIAVYAVAVAREVGVDVERIREDVDIAGVARRYFTADQRRQLDQLSPAARPAAFFAMWTRHEAYLKARGTGLGGADHPHDERSRWSVSAFSAGPGLAAAVAVEGTAVRVPLHAAEMAVEGVSAARRW